MPIMPKVVGSGFNLFNGEGVQQTKVDGPIAAAKRAAKKYIDENPDDFKEDA